MSKKSKSPKDPHAAREAEKYDNPIPSREFIMDLLEKRGQTMSRKEIASVLKLKDDDSLKNPIALGNSATQSAFDKIYSYVNDLTTIPEFLVGEALSSLEEFYSNLFPGSKALTDLLKKADQLINCLSNFCGGEYTSEVIALTNETQGLYR